MEAVDIAIFLFRVVLLASTMLSVHYAWQNARVHHLTLTIFWLTLWVVGVLFVAGWAR